MDFTGWLSGAPCYLLLNILALLYLWGLLPETRLSSSRALFDGVTVAMMICLNIGHGVHVALQELIPDSRRAGAISGILSLLAVPAVISVFLSFSQFMKRFLSSFTNHATTFQKPGLEPRILPCRTTHTRLFPKSHSFSYSYLYAGIPIGWTGSVNAFLSADTSGSKLGPQGDNFGKTWFSVHGCDYLHRMSTEKSLLRKLHQYLESQGVLPQQYPYVYLVTAPRFLGWSFNPVSFWYLYSEQKRLTAMILEVNNTFDERRMYFMEGTNTHTHKDTISRDVFLHSWAKDFHVSPFNERDGKYALKASDPFAPRMTGEGYIDNTITLFSSNGIPKIVAHVFSAEAPIIASGVSRLQALRFVCKWWWVGFMTNVRIVREARQLWMKGLQVFYRPEVMRTSIGRRATAEEDVLAENFMGVLRYIQQNALASCVIQYTAAAGTNRDITVQIRPADTPAGSASDLGSMVDLYILTPAFYSSFIRYSDSAEGFRDLCLCKAENKRLACLSDPEMFLRQIASVTHAKALSLPQELWWNCSVLEAARNSQLCRTVTLLLLAPFSTWSSSQLLQSSPPSLADLVALISDNNSLGDIRSYTRAVVSVFLAKKLALESMSLLQFYKILLRFFLLYLIAGRVQAVAFILHTVLVN